MHGLALLLLLAGAAWAADDPAWLKEAAALATPESATKAGAVVLIHEQIHTVDDNGRSLTTTRHAVRILSPDARSAASARTVYITGTAKVREFRAWLFEPSGAVKRYGKEKTLDVALANNDVYNEVRAKAISAASDADPGAVFGYESIVEDRAMFLQSEWAFQGRYPVIRSRYSVTLPAGWRAEGIMLAGPKLQPVTTGSAYTWELRDLRGTGTSPRLAVNFIPAAGSKAGDATVFTSWQDVSRWLTELAAPQAVADEAIAAKARALATGASTVFERIQAIGRFTQSINYVSIQTGIGRGGGYRPHPAPLVFAKSYGDCKDKANLMRTMLKTIGMDSYLVAIYSGNRNHVHREWPSPQQFNHVILAVKVAQDVEASAILQHPALGRLLIFDPTDTDTPVGHLPEHEQGSYALVAAGDAGDLVKMPMAEVSATRQERQTDIVLNADGDIRAKIEERSSGEAAARELRTFRHASAAGYRQAIEQWIVRGVKGAAVNKIEPVDSGSEFRLTVEFTAPRYAQSMQGRLLVFKPAIVSRREALPLGDTGSTTVSSQAYAETVTVKLPPGFQIDEMPAKVELDTRFGKYRLVCEGKGSELILTRSLEMRAATVAARESESLHTFYKKIMEAELSPVVLVRK